jgi:hypothetical protein
VKFGSLAAFAFAAGGIEFLSSDLDMISTKRVPEIAAQGRARPDIAGCEPAAEACTRLGQVRTKSQEY